MPETIFYNTKSKNKVHITDVTYGEDQDGSRPARIYRPESEGPFPLLLDVHGELGIR